MPQNHSYFCLPDNFPTFDAFDLPCSFAIGYVSILLGVTIGRIRSGFCQVNEESYGKQVVFYRPVYGTG